MTRLVVPGLVLAMAVAACAAPAAPPAAWAPASAPASSISYRDQVIAAARAEGEINILLSSIWTEEAIEEVLAAVEREYGVRLKVNRTPSTNYAAHAQTLISELNASASPSYDFQQSSDTSSAVLLQADAIEPVDWAALLPAGTPPGVIQGDGRLLVTYTAFNGLMYDPAVVPEQAVPRSLRDLADPRWRGKVAIAAQPDLHLHYVVKWGRDETVAALRAIMQNGAVAGTFFEQLTRYTAKEVAMIQVSTLIYASARLQGVPGQFALLDYAIDSAHHMFVPRRAPHGNAAKLFAAVIAGPEGQRIAAKYIGAGNRYYGGSTEHQLLEQARAAGVPEFAWWSEPGGMDFLLSPQAEDLRREILTIFRGG